MSLSAAELEPTKGQAQPILLSKTCQNCFILKIRCDRTQRTDICDRCNRLGKHCVFRPARRRDNSAKRDSRIQALEQQVQDLLRTQNPTPLSQQSLPEASESSLSANAPSTSSTASVPPDGDIIDEEILTPEQADTLVELYKSDMMPHFPFVAIQPHTTSRVLRTEKPFLFLAILSVACFHDLNNQERLGNRFKYMVSEKVLLGGDDCLSLEYLQGLLIVLAWNQYHGRSKYYSQYLQLAISIAVDMRLDRKPIRAKPSNPGSKRNPIANIPGIQAWGPDEQRASAGIFYLSSTISKLLDKMNTFPCTQFIEEGCLALQQKSEFKTDRDLYHVIRLQRIIESIDKIANQSSSEAEAQSSYLRVRSELEEFRAYLCSDVSDSHLLFMQFHTAKLFLYQVAFFERNLQHSPAIHLNILTEGLEGAKSFLDLYLWLPPKSEMALTNSEWIQLSFGVTLAAKFAIVSKDPNVELQTRELRQRLNIDNIFRHLSLRIGALVGRAGEGNKQKDIFFYYEQRVRKIQTWYERMVQATGSDSPLSQQANVHVAVANQRTPQRHPNSAGTTPSPQVPIASTYMPQPQHPPQYQHLPQHPQQQQHPSHNPPQHPQQQLPHVPQHQTYHPPQQALSYANDSLTSGSATDVGMTQMSSSYPHYNQIPTIAFPDLMNAPGWDLPFTIPMEDSWIFDVTQGYQAMNVPSPATNGTWSSPDGLQ